MTDMKAFEIFLQHKEQIELCENLYFTWHCIYEDSQLDEHYNNMHKARQTLVRVVNEQREFWKIMYDNDLYEQEGDI